MMEIAPINKTNSVINVAKQAPIAPYSGIKVIFKKTFTNKLINIITIFQNCLPAITEHVSRIRFNPIGIKAQKKITAYSVLPENDEPNKNGNIWFAKKNPPIDIIKA